MSLSNKLKVGQILGNPETNNYVAILYMHKDKVSFIQNGEMTTMSFHGWNVSYRSDSDFIECKGIELERQFIKAFFSEMENGYTFF